MARLFTYGAKLEEYPIEAERYYDIVDAASGKVRGRVGSFPFSIDVIGKVVENAPDQKVDLIYTDPPWDCGNENMFRSGVGKDHIQKEDFDQMMWDIAVASFKYSSKYLFLEWGFKMHAQMKDFVLQQGWRLLKEHTLLYPPPDGKLSLWFGMFTKDPNEQYVCTESTDGLYQSHWTTADKQTKTPSIVLWVHRNFQFNSIMDMFHGIGRFTRQAYVEGKNVYGNEFNHYKLAVFREYMEKKRGSFFYEVV